MTLDEVYFFALIALLDRVFGQKYESGYISHGRGFPIG